MDCDVAIVGAGPAGSTAAKILSGKGLKVILIDKNKFPREKACGGGLPIKVLQKFSYIKESKLIDSYSYGGLAHSFSLRYVLEVEKDEPLLAMVLREKFDEGLAKIAVSSGTKFIDGKTVIDVKISNNNARLTLADGTEINSKVVVGADGIWSCVAKKTGLSSNLNTYGLSVYEEFPLKSEILDKFFTKKRYGHLHLKIHGINGYGWVFPKKESVNIGIGQVDIKSNKENEKINLKEVLKNYIKLLQKQKIIPNEIRLENMRGAALPNHPLKKTYSNRVLLCGDAAGLINPLTGEGIDYAMYSGQMAAEVAYEAIKNNDVSERFLSKYEKKWKKEFGKDIKLFQFAAKRWVKRDEKILKLVSKDEILSDLLLDLVAGNQSIHKCRWKLLRRILFLRIKNIFSRSN